jgi:Immunity protein 51
MTIQPKWEIPEDLRDLVEEDESWESSDWDPIELSVIGGTLYKGRPIDLSWQIEFDPQDPRVQPATERNKQNGLDPDGYGWATLVKAVVDKYHPEIANEVQFGGTEESALVAWVESEDSCKTLMQVAWNLISTENA